MNRRVQGRVKQARKRAQKRVDIRAGRRMSMHQLMHMQHEEEVVPTLKPEVLANGETHMLVYKDTDEVIARGTEYQMRKQRTSMESSASDYIVRKIKVAV